jgi:spore coat protein A, manganese oxidase
VYAGLAGMYILRDEREEALQLPGSGAHELPLVVQDRRLAADGSLVYGPAEWIPEFFGDVAVVNGKAWPFLDVDRGWYRFHVVNGSNARVYDFRLSNGDPFIQVGTDGGLLPSPIAVYRLVLAPGERADVLVDFSALRSGEIVEVTNNAPSPYPDAKRSVHHGGVPLRSILQFRVGAATGDRRPLPSTLRPPIAPLPTSGTAFAGVRRMSLVEVIQGGEPLVSLLNNERFHEADPIEVEVDTVERWDFVNTTGDAHPIHLHLVQFQVLQRQAFDAAGYTAVAYPDPITPGAGPSPVPDPTVYYRGRARPPAPNEAGWKDTVRVDPGQVVSILVPFGAGAAPDLPIGRSYTGDYVWHCHILEHEDNEMMLPYRVVGG